MIFKTQKKKIVIRKVEIKVYHVTRFIHKTILKINLRYIKRVNFEIHYTYVINKSNFYPYRLKQNSITPIRMQFGYQSKEKSVSQKNER